MGSRDQPSKRRRLWRRRLRRRPLLPWLVGGAVAGWAVLSWMNVTESGFMGSDLGRALVLGLFAGQMGLLAAWAASSARGLWVRLAYGLLAIGLVLLCLLASSPPDALTELPNAFVQVAPVYLGAVGCCALAACLRPPSFSLRCPHCGEPITFFPKPERGLGRSRRFRLSLTDLLGWTTVCAALAAIVRLADWDRTLGEFDTVAAINYASLSLPLALAVTAAQSLARWRFWALIGLTAAILFFAYRGPGTTDAVLLSVVCVATCLAMIVFGVRLAGVRPVVRSRGGQPGKPADAPAGPGVA